MSNRNTKRRDNSLMRRHSISAALLATILASQQTQIGGFSMVAPPTRSTPPSEWITSTFSPIPIVEPEAIEFSLMPAFSSPLFGSSRKSRTRNHHWPIDGGVLNTSLTPHEMKRRILKQMTAIVADEIEQAQIAKERNDLLAFLQTDTHVLNKTVRDVLTSQENLQFVWDAAGAAAMEFGLSKDGGLPLPRTHQEEENLFHTVKVTDNMFDLITFSQVSSGEEKTPR